MPLRIEYAGACYHVINRGNYRRNLFAERKSGEAFEGAEKGVGAMFVSCCALVQDFDDEMRKTNKHRPDHLCSDCFKPNIEFGSNREVDENGKTVASHSRGGRS